MPRHRRRGLHSRSHLVEALLARGDQVVVLDCFTDHYEPAAKHDNLAASAADPRCEIVTADLASADLGEFLSGIEVVFHQAGQPGVRGAWGSGFDAYVRNNITATQRLLEACRDVPLRRFVQAANSSIYGNAPTYPTSETDVPRPLIPYGVTKLAAEHLCGLYAVSAAIPTVALRYFTAFGPRQRPDMAFHRLFEAALGGPAFPLFGSGEQRRDFTYVSDIVAGNLAAADADIPPATVVNLAGGSDASLVAVIDSIGRVAGVKVPLDRQPAKAGDVTRTGGAINVAGRLLAWRPAVSLYDSLVQQYQWHPRRQATG